ETASPGLFPNGYQPYLTYTAEDANVAGGLKYASDVLGAFDLGVSFGTNETGRTVYSTLNPSWGAASPTEFYLGSWKNRTTSVTLDYSRDLPATFASNAVISAGALYRNEHWATADFGDYIGYTTGPLGGSTVASLYGPGGAYSAFASQFPGVNFATDTSVIPATGSSTSGLQPVDASSVSRRVLGGYAGVDFKLLDRIDVGLTARYEDYSDFGDTTTYRATARYEFSPAFAVRGTVSSGFHAPSIAALGQQTTGYTSTFTNNGSSVLTPGRTRLFRSADPLAANFGAKPLEPEESTTYSLGFVVRPDETSSITVDAYRLDIKDVITNSDPVQGATVSAAYARIGLAGYTQASYYLNAWDAKTEGVDVVGRKQLELGAGRLELTAATSFLNTDVRNINDT
ncbi:MAG: TonB-dependent receptor, partial [Rhodococcus sp. (in: high G+C Gram-positive bacteria)]